MAKYKICPECGSKYIPSVTSCINDNFDLTKIDFIVDESDLIVNDIQYREVNCSKSYLSVGKKVKICDVCGNHNPINYGRCEKCNSDLDGILPVDENRDIQINRFILKSADGQCEFEIKKEITIIGRENEMQEYLASKDYVSREHAILKLVQNNIYIQNRSKSNHTFVNNKKIPDGKFIELNNNDEIGLGGIVNDGQRQKKAAYFFLRIEKCI